MNKGTLYIVATPIGNLGDITLRALDILKSVDLILCEDTRVTSKLLAHFEIKKSLESYHHHSDARKIRQIVSYLQEGKSLALVTDAGTPGISDPGNILISELAQIDSEVKIVPIPGASAVTSALSISGFPTDKFLFLGFPPHKNKRQKFFQTVAASEYTTVFYESSHRILKCLEEIKKIVQPEKKIVVCRELTKQFESVYRGTVGGIDSMRIPEKGEFVIVVSSK